MSKFNGFISLSLLGLASCGLPVIKKTVKDKNVLVPVNVSLSVDHAQIYAGETVKLSWTAEQASSCLLKANGAQLAQNLGLIGSELYAPIEATTYEITCNNQGQQASSKVIVNILANDARKFSFPSLAAFEAAIDTNALTDVCGKSCIYAEFDHERLQLADDGSYQPTSQFISEIEGSLAAVKSRALFVVEDSSKIAFDLNRSFAYGHRSSLIEANLAETCKARFPLLEDGAVFLEEPEFIGEGKAGTGLLPAEKIEQPIVAKLDMSAKAPRGLLKKDAEVTVSYTLGQLEVRRAADYLDYKKVRGGYSFSQAETLTNNAQLRPLSGQADAASESLMSYSGNMLRGYVKKAPADGIEVPPPPTNIPDSQYFPEPKRLPNGNYDPNDELCRVDRRPFYFKCYEPNTPCDTIYVGAIDQKPGFKKQRSARVIADTASIQCNTIFPEVARSLNLANEWLATTELQYFVTDNNFPGCGGNCIDKEARSTENDWRFENIEPANNRCINRWEGLDWNSYRGKMEIVCNAASVYSVAVAANAQGNADTAFSNSCGQSAACDSALKGMNNLASKFSAKSLSDLIDREELTMNKAKAEGHSYLITEPKLAVTFINAAKSDMAAIETGLETARSIHAEKKSNWLTANLKIHQSASVQGFDSFDESKESIASYQKQLARIDSLNKLDLRETGCSYEVKGRFRKFSNLKTPIFNLILKKQETFKSKAKQDTKIE